MPTNDGHDNPGHLAVVDLQNAMLRFSRAAESLVDWIDGARAMALLHGATRCGLFEELRSPRSEEALATLVDGDHEVMRHVIHALDAYGIVDRHGDSVRLAGPFQTLTSSDALQSLGVIVARTLAECRLLEHILNPEAVLTHPMHAIALADGVTYASSSAVSRGLLAAIYDDMPEARDRLASGGAYLELGCGVGGGLLSTVQVFPSCTAVGVELNPAIAEEISRRAEALGVADRVETRCMDVRTIADASAFDVAYWSYAFFPRETHEGALAAAWRALKPAGWLWMPRPGPAHDDVEPQDHRSRDAAISRLLAAQTGNVEITVGDLVGQLEAAGFADVRIVDASLYPLVTARRL